MRRRWMESIAAPLLILLVALLSSVGRVVGQSHYMASTAKNAVAQAPVGSGEGPRAVEASPQFLPCPAAGDSNGLIAYGHRDADGRQQIFVANADGTGKRQLTQEGKRNFFPAWSPDGKRLAWVSDRSGSPQIWVMDADGNNPTQLTTEGENANPVWAPDGRKLAFASTQSGQLEIWVMEADGSHPKQLTTTTAAGLGDNLVKIVAMEMGFFRLKATTAVGISNNFPTWSPDGRRIAFCSTRGGSFAIWGMDADGDHLTQLTTPHGSSFPYSNIPIYSPDGSKIAFWSGVDLGPGQIWVMNPDGSNRKQLTHPPAGVNCDEPAWSPDGSRIVFTRNGPGGDGIGIMDADGSNERVFVTKLGDPSRTSWQPVCSRP